MTEIILGLGSNMGDRVDNIEKCHQFLNQFVGEIKRKSALYESEPWGFKSSQNFINQVIIIYSDLSPEELLTECKRIEVLLGRTEKEGKEYQSRTADIDILFMNQLIYKSDRLIIPHPLISDRKFILLPLCSIYSDFIHPVLEKNIETLLKNCEDQSLIFEYLK